MIEPITSLNDPLEPLAEEETDERGKHDGRLKVLTAVILLGLLILVVQLYRLQIVQGAAFREEADNNRFRLMTISPPRGVIYDRNHTVLARNRPSYSIGVIRADLPADPMRAVVFRRLATLIGMSVADITRTVDADPGDQFSFIPLRSNVPPEIAFQVEERHRDLPGVHVQPEPIREYPLGPVAAPVIGYVGRISDAQYQRLKDDPVRRYSRNDTIGQVGIEQTFEGQLRGQPGAEQMEVDATGRQVRSLGAVDPVPGHNLVLTIDARLQQTIYRVLSAGLDRYQMAAAVALDPRNGQVLALVSVPSYDDNLFAGGISTRDYEALLNDPRHPLINQAISSAFPPGATFHLVTAAAGLETGVISPRTKIDCNGSITVPNRYDPTVGTRLNDWKAFGPQDVVSAIADSCNVFFYEVGGGDPSGRRDGVGIDALGRYARLLGLGTPTGIDLVGESDGLVPTVRWKRQTLNQEWVPMDTYLTSVGLGYVTVTPLQMAVLAAAIANGGTLYRPQLVLETVDAQGRVVSRFTPDVARRLPLKPETLSRLREGMVDAVRKGQTDQGTSYDGAAQRAAVPGLAVAGVVGSPEFGTPDKNGALPTHGWFVGFAPADRPRLALAVFVWRGTGPGDAAQIASQIFSTLIFSTLKERS